MHYFSHQQDSLEDFNHTQMNLLLWMGAVFCCKLFNLNQALHWKEEGWVPFQISLSQRILFIIVSIPKHLPGNKALLGDYEVTTMVNSPLALIRPYFLGRWHWGGTVTFPGTRAGGCAVDSGRDWGIAFYDGESMYGISSLKLMTWPWTEFVFVG